MKEKSGVNLNENNVDEELIQQLLEEDDVNVDGESNIDFTQCPFGC